MTRKKRPIVTEKTRKRGDKHPSEDLIFWGYGNLPGGGRWGEIWITPDEVEAKAAYVLEKGRRYANNNRELVRKRSREWRRNNPEKANECFKNWADKNKGHLADYAKLRRKRGPKAHTRYIMRRRAEDPLFRRIHSLRALIPAAIRRAGFRKTSRTSAILGCTCHELVDYIASKFTASMSWDNYGKWHIDHIIPISSAKTVEEAEKLNHHTNLQPLWHWENESKGNKIDWMK